MMGPSKGLLLLVVLLQSAAGSVVFAQDPGPINTERPSFSSSPLALFPGYWQIEAGYEYGRSTGSNGFRDQSLPNALLRFGFYRNFELQLNWTGYSWSRSSATETNGFKDASLGVKWQLNEADSAFVAGLFAGVSLPIGDGELTSDDYDPELALFWTYAGRLDWFGAVKLTHSESRHKLQNAIGINLELAPKTSAFLEYEGSYPEGRGPAHELNLGVLWLLADELQVDLNGSVGLNGRATDFGLGAGIAYRF
jgi:hypothetical protein